MFKFKKIKVLLIISILCLTIFPLCPSATGGSSGCSNNYGGIEYKNGTIQILPQCSSSGGAINFEDKMSDSAGQMFRLFRFIWIASLIISFISLILGAVQLAASAGNQNAKGKAWGRIKISLTVMACLGGIGTIIGLAFNLFA